MRDFIEPSMRNLLRRPLVLGVPVQGLLALSVGTVSLSIFLGSEVWGNAATVIKSQRKSPETAVIPGFHSEFKMAIPRVGVGHFIRSRPAREKRGLTSEG
jgi:hypothetical protein